MVQLDTFQILKVYKKDTERQFRETQKCRVKNTFESGRYTGGSVGNVQEGDLHREREMYREIREREMYRRERESSIKSL
jgi:hypothetical protein